jgi:hypothetical protein
MRHRVRDVALLTVIVPVGVSKRIQGDESENGNIYDVIFEFVE